MSLQQKRPIVVVDDSEEDFFFIKRLLEKCAVTEPILPFTGGEEAIKYLGRVASGTIEPPLVCFLDIKMPGYTGFDVLDALHASDELDKIPAIMLSSSDDRRDILKAAEKNAQGYLVKYPSADTLRAVIDEARKFPARRGKAERWSLELKENLLPR